LGGLELAVEAVGRRRRTTRRKEERTNSDEI